MRLLTGATLPARQRGVVFLAMLTMLVLASLYAVTSRLHQATALAPLAREARAFVALNRAKAALIAFAAENPNRPGGLPCPDLDGDGEAELQCDHPTKRIGLLPWQTLKTGELRDESGHKLWYAVSGSFRNDPVVAINSNTLGELSVVSRLPGGGTATSDHLVALVLAPGAPLPGQHRNASTLPRTSDYLEGENASGDPRVFAVEPKGGTFNDVVVALGHDELFAIVDRVVASRIASEIVPILRQRVVGPWRALPFAVPFEDPGHAVFVDVGRRDGLEGLMPVGGDAEWVGWRDGSVTVEQEGGGGNISAANCLPSVRRELRCDIHYSGDVRIRVSAIVDNVGRALVSPPSADAQLGPESLRDRVVVHGPIERDGSARIIARANLPALGRLVRVQLGAPAPIRELTDPSVPVSTPHSWFARNRWFEGLYYALSPAIAPGTGARDCTVGAALGTHCLSIETPTETRDAAATLILMGTSRVGLPRPEPDSLASYLEGDNASPGDGRFSDLSRSTTFNDALILICRNAGTGCAP